MLQVNGVKQVIKHPTDDVSQETRSRTCLVQLRLYPVGARVSLKSSEQLCNLVNSLLATLAPIHAAGFVHRDIRLDNIVKGPDGWRLETGSLLEERIYMCGGNGRLCRLASRLGMNHTLAKLTFGK